MYDLQEMEAIKQLKYKYVRCLDLKRWQELRECFTDDATSAYSGGKYTFDSPEAIIKFLVDAHDPPEFFGYRHCHHPEITFTSPTTATGLWALEYEDFDLKDGLIHRGAAYYQDEYLKLNGQWKIKFTGYDPIFISIEKMANRPGLQIVENGFAKK